MASAKLQRVRRPLLSDVVFDQLLDRIVNGFWAVGDDMPPERLLGEELGVSRTALRAALARLAQLRLIQIRQGGDTRVLDFRKTAGLDLLPYMAKRSASRVYAELLRSSCELRAILAPDMARLCAMRAGEDVMGELELVVTEMSAQTRDLKALHVSSVRFWTTIATGCLNLAYELAFNTLREAIGPHVPKLGEAMEDELRDLKGYRAIAKAVRDADPAAAQRAAKANIELGLSGLLALSRARR